MSGSQQIGKDLLKFCLRLAKAAETPEVAFQHEPIADADPANQERLAGAVHDLSPLRMHELRMGCRSSQHDTACNKKQSGVEETQAPPPLSRRLRFYCKNSIKWSAGNTTAYFGEPGRLQQCAKFT